MKLSEAMASLTPEQREAVEARFEALKIELAHAEGAAIIATDRPNEEFNERLAEMNAALRARVAELEAGEASKRGIMLAQASRLAELEGDLNVARLQLSARVCSECPARARLAELEYVAGLMWDRYEDGEPCYEGMTDDDTGTYTGQAVYFSDEETARILAAIPEERLPGNKEGSREEA